MNESIRNNEKCKTSVFDDIIKKQFFSFEESVNNLFDVSKQSKNKIDIVV